ncbi:TonB-dependent receptor domain-containing protein [Pseudomonas sp. GCM10022188]|uniref:TonB-dependent receptor domain-containing protein n=1 Tax=Pseudomonas TaxID=286 RepID=UPI001E306F22|nr:TonB-dependent receptor [Pseudomonas oryzagri]MCC6077525.1 TonB-dependent receptor [Pseudomonas oryzagri]
MKLSRLALAVSVLPASLLAAESPGSLEEQLKLPALVITSGRQAELRAQATNLTTVFTRNDIERLQPSNVGELLSRVPGVQITQNGGRGSLTGLNIRGTKSAQSIVLVDGQRIVDAAGGAAQLQALSIEQIERIEVLRGPRSALYGADAIGGVVQIFTRRTEGPGLQPRLHIGYGSRGTWERSLGLSGGDGATRFSLNASADATNGIDRTSVGSRPNSDHDAYRNNGVSLNLSHRFSERLEGGFSVLDQRGESEYDLSFDGAYPYNDFQLTSYAGFLAAQLNETWSSRVELGHSENRSVERFDDVATASPFNTYRDSVAWLNTLTLGGGHSLLAGLDWYEETLHTTSTYSEDQRWNQAALLQHRFAGERFSTELGLRHDKNEQFGSQNTFNGALTVPLDADNDLVLSYAEGFRAPTFTDLYYPDSCFPGFGCFTFANPNLKPEQSKTYELQWRSQLAEKTRLEAALYRTDLEDAIVFSDIPRNVQKARINGFEASLQQELFGWQSALGLSLIDPRDRDSGHILNRRAKRTLSLDVDRRFGAASVGASWQAISHSYDDVANERKIAGYGLLNIRSSWQATPEIEVGLKLDNVLDKEYSNALYDHDFDGQYNAFRETGRTALASVTWTPSL